MPRPAKQHGLTLIELMVALAIGMLLSAAIVALFIQNKESTRQNETVNRMQESARFAMQILRNELWHADLLGDLTDSSSLTNGSLTALATNCGDANWYNTVATPANRLNYLRDVTSLTPVPLPCVSSASYVAPFNNGNMLLVKRVTANPVTNVAGGADNRLYIRSNGTIGVLYHFDSDAALPPVGGNAADWAYQANIFYVGAKINPDNSVNNTIPVLYRSYLQGGVTPTMTNEPLVDGVEYFHLQIGIDNNDDGIVNYYTDAPSAAELGQAMTARIYVLVRAERPVRGYVNSKNYIVGNGINISQNLVGATTFGDSYPRRIYSTTIILKNPRNQALLGS